MKKKKIFRLLAIMMTVLLVSGTFSAAVFGAQGEGETISGSTCDGAEDPGSDDDVDAVEDPGPEDTEAVVAAEDLGSEDTEAYDTAEEPGSGDGAETEEDNRSEDAEAFDTAEDQEPSETLEPDAGESIPEESSPDFADVEERGEEEVVSEERSNDDPFGPIVYAEMKSSRTSPQYYGSGSIELWAQPSTMGYGTLWYTYYVISETQDHVQVTAGSPGGKLTWTPGHIGHYAFYAVVRDPSDNNRMITSEQIDFDIVPAPLLAGSVVVSYHLKYGQKLSEAVFSDTVFHEKFRPRKVTGTLSFDDLDVILPVGTHEVGWTFTPDSENYLPCTGTVRVTVDACEHDVGVDVVGDKEPTCTEPGATGQKVCARCREVLEESTEIPANGHSWDDGRVATEPTVDREGVMEYRCTVEGCDGIKTEPIPKLDNPISVKGAVITGVVDKTYNGSAQTQNPVVKIGDKTLIKGTDYNITYSNNVNAGTATMTITGTGNYNETVSASFKIAKAAQNFNVKAASSAIDAGKTTKVTVSGAKEKPAYTYTSLNTSIATVDSSGTVTGKAAGTATITVKAAATANYNAGTKTVKITVNKVLKKPGNCHFVKWNNAKYTSCRIAWNKTDGAEGYETLLSWTDGSHASTTVVKSSVLFRDCAVAVNHVSQMKVRAFYTLNGSRRYGPWSNVEYITPSPTTLTSKNTSTSASNLKMNIGWNIIYGCNGYNVFLTTNPNGTWYWNQSTSESAASNSAVITKYRGSKLKKNTRYYVRIVTRRKRNGVFCTVPMPAANTNIGSFVIK